MSFSLPINEFFWPVAASVAAAFLIYVFKRIVDPSRPDVDVRTAPVTHPATLPPQASAPTMHSSVTQAERDWKEIAETGNIAIIEAFIERHKSEQFYVEMARAKIQR